MITLRSLVTAAPFDDKTRDELIKKIDENTLTDDQKFQISGLCWDMIFRLYQMELQIKIDSMLMESAEGKKSYSQNDFTEEKLKFMNDFANKLHLGQSQHELEEIRKQLDSRSN